MPAFLGGIVTNADHHFYRNSLLLEMPAFLGGIVTQPYLLAYHRNILYRLFDPLEMPALLGGIATLHID